MSDSDDEELVLQLGLRIIQMITAKYGADIAQEFLEAATIPTMPGTPERARQDHVEMGLADLLEAIAP